MIAPLSGVAEINPPQPDHAVADDTRVSFVPMAAVEERTGKLDASETRAWADVRKGYKRFQDSDVLFAKITPCMENGKVALAERLHGGVGAGSTEFHVVRPTAVILPRFVLHFLLQQSVRREARQVMQGAAGQLRVPESFLTDLQIVLPPLREQERIVSEIDAQFTRLAAAVSALERVRANLKRYRASVLKAACEGRLVPTEAELARREGRDYEPADVLLERILKERRARWEAEELARLRAQGKEPRDDRWKRKYKEPPAPDTRGLPELPEGWVWASLEQLLAELRNGISRKPTGDSGTRILRISAVRALEVDLSDVRFLRENGSEFDRFELADGDLLFTRYNGNPAFVGVCGVVAGLTERTLYPDKLIRGRLASSDVIPSFIEAVINAGWSRDFIIGRTKTTAGQSGIAGADLKRVPIPLPPVSEQRRIVDEVASILALSRHFEGEMQRAVRRASRLRQSILKRAFEGRLVPQDPSDEPASELLARIRAEHNGAR